MVHYTYSYPTEGGVVVHSGHNSMLFSGITLEQMRMANEEYNAGAYIQDAYPFLTSDQREFLMTGLRPDQRDDLFLEEEE